MDELEEKLARQTYEFVHRGKTHMSWEELPYKWGKKAYYEFASEITEAVSKFLAEALKE